MPRNYIVSEKILPPALLKTAQVKELLRSGKAKSVAEAVGLVGIVRSTYYKYKDGIWSFYDLRTMNIVNISMMLTHRSGMLAEVIKTIAGCSGNVLTINQSLPSFGSARVTLSVALDEATAGMEEMLTLLSGIEGASDVMIDGGN